MSETAWISSGDQLGEGPCWDHRRGWLWWVDILRARLHRCDDARQDHRSWELPRRVSALALTRDPDRLLVGSEAGVESFDSSSGALTLLAPFPADEPPANRSNDGGVDLRGRFWLGTMSEVEGESSGSFYVYERGRLRRVLSDWGIPNTACFSPDGRMYLADSARRELYAYTLDAAGLPGERTRFADSPRGGATPDGSALDAEGHLWNCEWGGARVVRYTPAGAIERVVELPPRQTTACCFGGPKLEDLFVTSARVGREDEPGAGHVYRVHVGVPGLPTTIAETPA